MHKSIVLPLMMIALALTACGVSRGSGTVVTETREVRSFNRVSLTTIGELILTQGEQESLEIEAEDNVLPRISTAVRDETLVIEMKDLPWRAVVPTRAIKFRVTMREIAALHLSGAGTVHAPSVETDDLEVAVSGAGGVTIGSLTADTLDVSLSGIGGIDLAGQVTEQSVTLTGSGGYRASRLESQSAEVTISGAGSATVWVNDTLDVTISGLGGVQYYGSPRVSQNITGAGRVNSLGNP